MKKRNVLFVILYLLTTFFIFKNSAKSAQSSTVQSGFFVQFAMDRLSFLFNDVQTATHYVRKAAHFAEFFAQGAFLSAALFSTGYHKRFIYVLFSGLLTACTDEYIQLFFEGRGSMVSDIFIDFSGTCAAAAGFMVLWYLIKKAGRKV